jgi:hypothetical protein
MSTLPPPPKPLEIKIGKLVEYFICMAQKEHLDAFNTTQTKPQLILKNQF